MKVYIGGTEYNLTDKDFISEGGEGKIYGKSDKIIKIYHDPARVIPRGKINELSVLSSTRNVITPIDIVESNKGIPIGYVMPWIKNTVPLCKLFTNDYRNRFAVNDDMVLELIDIMASVIQQIHNKGTLMVDGNEMNYLVSNDHKHPYFIDVDSYQTKSYPATAIMPSIKDYHSNGFSELTDWFSFGIVSFQMFIGIHPFKGSHPNYKKGDLESRMRDNVSVLNSEVKIPPMARDFSRIPPRYLKWYKSMFEHGERMSIYDVQNTSVAPTIKIKVAQPTYNQQFEITLICELSPIDVPTGMFKYRLIDSGNMVHGINKMDSYAVMIIDNKLKITNLSGKAVNYNDIMASDVMVANNTIYAKYEDKLYEVAFFENFEKPLFAVSSVVNVMPNSTHMFPGVIYQNILGRAWMTIPHKDANGKSRFSMKEYPELNGYNVLEIKLQRNIMNVIAEKNGHYTSFLYQFEDANYDKYDYIVEDYVDYHVPNFIVLDSGVAIRITTDDEIWVFRDIHKVMKKTDGRVNFSVKLETDGSKVYLMDNNKMYSFKMK